MEDFVADNKKEDCQFDHEFALDDEFEDETIEPALLPGTSNIELAPGHLESALRGRRASSNVASEQRKPRQGSMTSNISYGTASTVHASDAERSKSHSNHDIDNAEARSTLSVKDNTTTTRRMSRTSQIMKEEMNVISNAISIPDPTSDFKMGLEAVLQTPVTELVAFEVEEVPDHRATGKIASWRGAMILVWLYLF